MSEGISEGTTEVFFSPTHATIFAKEEALPMHLQHLYLSKISPHGFWASDNRMFLSFSRLSLRSHFSSVPWLLQPQREFPTRPGHSHVQDHVPAENADAVFAPMCAGLRTKWCLLTVTAFPNRDPSPPS